MAQTFYELQGTGKLKEDRSKINQNFLTVASNFSGTAFPTENLGIGQTCYRTDLKCTYRYIAENVWRLESDMSGDTTAVVEASHASSADTLSTARTIAISGAVTGTATEFDGSKNITIVTTKLDATKLSGTASISTTGNAATATLATKATSATSATSATTATYDTEGQNIAGTYIKSLSASGTTVTYTKGDGTTGTVATQDTTSVDPTSDCSLTVTASTQGNLSYASLYTYAGVDEGTYTLQEIIQLLVNKSHTHAKIVTNCDCDCNCDCGDDSGGEF